MKRVFNGVKPTKVMSVVRMKKKGHRSYDYIANQVELTPTTVERIATSDAFEVIKSMAHEKFVGKRSYQKIADKYGMKEEQLKSVLKEFKVTFC